MSVPPSRPSGYYPAPITINGVDYYRSPTGGLTRTRPTVAPNPYAAGVNPNTIVNKKPPINFYKKQKPNKGAKKPTKSCAKKR